MLLASGLLLLTIRAAPQLKQEKEPSGNRLLGDGLQVGSYRLRQRLIQATNASTVAVNQQVATGNKESHAA
jgi:hypothetical protein